MTLSNCSKSEKNGSSCSQMECKFSSLQENVGQAVIFLSVCLLGKGREQPRAICAAFLSLFSTKKPGELLSS